MPYHPDYLAYTVPCPLNAGKLVQVVDYVRKWRLLAEREATWQWKNYFQNRGVEGFEASATKGWKRLEPIAYTEDTLNIRILA